MTKLFDIADEYQLELMEENGRIKVNKHPDAELWIYNYTNKAQFANEWTHEERVCRGLIVDAQGAIIARGMPKFFNYGDPRVGEEITEDTFFQAFTKFDGSLGVCYVHDGDVHVATRGSFTSEQAVEASSMIYEGRYAELCASVRADAKEGFTTLVEIIYPENKIVVDYGAHRVLQVLGVVDNATGEFFPDFDNIVRNGDGAAPAIPEGEEGFVCQTASGTLFKVKSEEYLLKHRTKFSLSTKTVWEILSGPDAYNTFRDLRNSVDADIAVWLDRKYKLYQAKQWGMYRKTLDIHDLLSEDFPDRKTLAQRLQRDEPEYLSLVFAFIDKGPDDLLKLINKRLKPTKFEPYAKTLED